MGRSGSDGDTVSAERAGREVEETRLGIEGNFGDRVASR
jgi:hypothetical protein